LTVILFAEGSNLKEHIAYKLNKDKISNFEKPLFIKKKIRIIKIKIVNSSKKYFTTLFKNNNFFVRFIEMSLLYLN
jgi:hypothetical protein